MDAPGQACRNELNRRCRDSRGADSCLESLQAKPETQRWHWGSRRKDPHGSVALRVYDDDLSTDEETDSDTQSWGDGSWGDLDSDEDRRTHQDFS